MFFRFGIRSLLCRSSSRLALNAHTAGSGQSLADIVKPKTQQIITLILKKIVILGSSRKDGNTKQAIDNLNLLSDFDIIDLNDFDINYYVYEHRNKSDDYLDLMRNIIDNYDILIFATPVYWYSMSGIMKVFFDRITDLLDNEKELGRKLRNKNMAVLSSSLGDHLGEKFWLPFIETAKYLGMNYLGNVHTIVNSDQVDDLTEFAKLINERSTTTNR